MVQYDKSTKFGECPLQFIDYLLKLRERKNLN